VKFLELLQGSLLELPGFLRKFSSDLLKFLRKSSQGLWGFSRKVSTETPGFLQESLHETSGFPRHVSTGGPVILRGYLHWSSGKPTRSFRGGLRDFSGKVSDGVPAENLYIFTLQLASISTTKHTARRAPLEYVRGDSALHVLRGVLQHLPVTSCPYHGSLADLLCAGYANSPAVEPTAGESLTLMAAGNESHQLLRS